MTDKSDVLSPVELGEAMWAQLRQTFAYVADANDCKTHERRAQLWAGYLAAMSGTMAKELGISDAGTLLKTALQIVEQEIKEEAVH